MTPEFSSIILVIGLFLLGVVSPGPNFLVVVERSMASGFRGGLATGVGVALGDALYAGAGILGVTGFMSRVGWLFAAVKILGGIYIAWIGGSMIWGSQRGVRPGGSREEKSVDATESFRRGLLTDLSNPKTIVFFTSIFAAGYHPDLPAWVALSMWCGIVTASITWRTGLALAFSSQPVRALYRRFRRGVETLFGGMLVLFGVRLAVGSELR